MGTGVAAWPTGLVRADSELASADVVISGDLAAGAGLEEVVAELLDRRGIAAHVARVRHFDAADFLHSPATAGAGGRIWIDLRDPFRVRIFLADATGARFAMRELALRGRIDELARESIGQLVAAAASALSEGSETTMSLEEAERTLGITTPRPPDRLEPEIPAAAPLRDAIDRPPARVASVDIGIFYAARAFAPQHRLTDGPGLLLDWGRSGARIAARLWLLLGLELPVSLGEGAVSGSLITTTGRVGPALEWSWAGASLSGGAGVGIDLAHVASHPGSDPAARLNPATWLAVPSVRLQLVVKTHLGRRVYLLSAVVCDIDLLTTQYQFVQVGQEVDAVGPWRFHPGILLGAMWR